MAMTSAIGVLGGLLTLSTAQVFAVDPPHFMAGNFIVWKVGTVTCF